MASIKSNLTWGITGASGQLGQTLMRVLQRKGARYLAWGHSELDISESGSIEFLVRAKPDVIINCAAYTAVDQAEQDFDTAIQVNSAGALNVARGAKSLKVPLVQVSTDYVFSGSSQTPWKVGDKTEPTTRYGISKLHGEDSVRAEYGENSYILRTAWLYSPFGKNFAKTILRKAISGEEVIKVVSDQTGQPTNTFDVAERIIELIEKGVEVGTYHVTNSGQASWFDFAAEIFELANKSRLRVQPINSDEYQTPTPRPSYSVLDDSTWELIGLPKLPNWKEALHRVFPSILESVERELGDGKYH